MCYAGGPYCYGHMKTRLNRAVARIEKNPSPENQEKLEKAQELYDSTPQGQNELKDEMRELDLYSPRYGELRDRCIAGLRLRAAHMRQKEQRKKEEKAKKASQSAEKAGGKETVKEGVKTPQEGAVRFRVVATSHLKHKDPVTGELYNKDENGKRHSFNDKPAVVHPNGAQLWMKHGTFHRDGDLPSKIHPNGQLEYKVNGVPHRDNEDHPAYVDSHGTFHFYKDGERVEGRKVKMQDAYDGQTFDVPVAVSDKLDNFEKAGSLLDSEGDATVDKFMPSIMDNLKKNNHREAVSAMNAGMELLIEKERKVEWVKPRHQFEFDRLVAEEKSKPLIHLPENFYANRMRG